MSSKSKPVIGIVEWLSDSGTEPAVFLGDTTEQVRRAVVKYLAPMVDNGSIEYVGGEWRAEHPAPDLDDAAAVTAWLSALGEATTDAWLSIYTAPSWPLDPTEPGSDTYADVREG